MKGKLENRVGRQYPLHYLGTCCITTADEHTSAASSRLNWRPCRFKRTRPLRRKTKSGFCACAITFQTQCNTWFCVFSIYTYRYQRAEKILNWRAVRVTKCNICLNRLRMQRNRFYLKIHFLPRSEHTLSQLQNFCLNRLRMQRNRFYLTLRRLMSYIYGAPILDVSRSHTTTHHSR